MSKDYNETENKALFLETIRKHEEKIGAHLPIYAPIRKRDLAITLFRELVAVGMTTSAIWSLVLLLSTVSGPGALVPFLTQQGISLVSAQMLAQVLWGTQIRLAILSLVNVLKVDPLIVKMTNQGHFAGFENYLEIKKNGIYLHPQKKLKQNIPFGAGVRSRQSFGLFFRKPKTFIFKKYTINLPKINEDFEKSKENDNNLLNKHINKNYNSELSNIRKVQYYLKNHFLTHNSVIQTAEDGMAQVGVLASGTTFSEGTAVSHPAVFLLAGIPSLIDAWANILAQYKQHENLGMRFLPENNEGYLSLYAKNIFNQENLKNEFVRIASAPIVGLGRAAWWVVVGGLIGNFPADHFIQIAYDGGRNGIGQQIIWKGLPLLLQKQKQEAKSKEFKDNFYQEILNPTTQNTLKPVQNIIDQVKVSTEMMDVVFNKLSKIEENFQHDEDYKMDLLKAWQMRLEMRGHQYEKEDLENYFCQEVVQVHVYLRSLQTEVKNLCAGLVQLKKHLEESNLFHRPKVEKALDLFWETYQKIVSYNGDIQKITEMTQTLESCENTYSNKLALETQLMEYQEKCTPPQMPEKKEENKYLTNLKHFNSLQNSRQDPQETYRKT